MFLKLVKNIFINIMMLSYAATAISMEQPQQIAERKNQAVFRLIDVTGQDVIVSPKHSAQLLRCFAVNKLFDGYTLNLAQAPEMATHQNLQKLFDLMAGDIKLEHLSASESITLFKLANYLDARAALKILAPAAYAIEKKEKQKDQDQELLLTIVSCLSSYDSIEKLVEFKKENALKRLYHPATGTLKLTPEAIQAKITSLNGMETLTRYCDPTAVIILDASNQGITDFRVADLKKAFPRLKQLNLSGNQIDQITCPQLAGMPKGFRLCLDNNPITNIEIGCFNNFSRFKECLLSLQNTKLTLAQEQEAFSNNQIQARLNPVGLMARANSLLYLMPHITFFGTAAFTLFSCVNAMVANRAVLDNLTQKVSQEYTRGITSEPDLLILFDKTHEELMSRSFWARQGFKVVLGSLCLTGSLGITLIGNPNTADLFRAWFQVRSPFHLHVTTDRARYNFPSIHHV